MSAADVAAGSPSDGPASGADDPEAYVAEDRRRALAAGRQLPERVRGAALFADISGFTPLTEALVAELGAQRGAEELTVVLDRVFDEVLSELHAHGGSVLYFSGDAVTCWLDGDTGLAATACALAMQEAMGRVGTTVTPAGRVVGLAMKVAVAVGSARRFVVGDPRVQLLDVLAGALMDRLAAAEKAARSGEVVLESAIVDALGDRVDVAERRSTGGAEHCVARGLTVPVATAPPAPPSARLPEEVVRPWLLPPVYERMRSGRGEFLAELRPAVPFFIRFGGLDFDGDEGAAAALDDFVVRAQRVIDGYGGNTVQITVGDKGAYLYAVFGSPLAHEDDAARACAAALDVLALESVTAVTGLQVGVAAGRLRSGTTGHRRRRTYTCLGDATNLAARLMSAAPPGAAYVSDRVMAAAGRAFAFEELPPLALKGKAAPVTAGRLLGAARAGAPPGQDLPPLVGRDPELALLRAEAEQGLAGLGRVIGVTAGPGCGKSRLVAELTAELAARGARVLTGAAQPYGVETGYAAWRGVWHGLLGLEADPAPAGLAARLEQVLPAELLPRLPLAGALSGVALPDTPLTASFDAKLRKSSLEELAVRVLAASAEVAPLVVVLEDAHRLDPLSRDLLVALVRECPRRPVTIVLTYRPGDSPLLGLGLAELAPATELVLVELPPASAATLVAHRLAELFGPERPVAPELARLLAERSDGNPLYVRELCSYLAEREVDPGDPAAVSALELPSSLQSLVLSRIDRLAEEPRRTAKVASVVGRAFAAPLVGRAYPELGSAADVDVALAALARRDLAVPEDPTAVTWMFTHAVIRDVAYESLPFAMRTLLHGRVGRALEAGALGDPERRLDELAYHFWHSDDDDRKREYLLRAGIAAQAAYANETALDWFRRLVPLLGEGERPAVLVRAGKVLELVGAWADAERSYAEAHELASRHGDLAGAAWARTWLAEVARKQGRYDDAARGLAEAGTVFTQLGDDAGAAQVLHLRGTLAAQRGEYDAASRAYRQSLGIRERLGDLPSMAALLSNLAIVAEYRGDYDAAQDLGEQALALRQRSGDRWGIGISQNNLGMLAVLRRDPLSAKARFAESMRLHTECGDAWMVALGHNNLGNACRDLGEHAEAVTEYTAALTTYRHNGDEWALAILYEDVARLAADVEAPQDAALLLGASDAARARVGSPRAPDVEAQVEAVLVRLRGALGDRLDGLREQGRTLPGEEADRYVLGLAAQVRGRDARTPGQSEPCRPDDRWGRLDAG